MIREKGKQYFKRFNVTSIYGDVIMNATTALVVVIPAFNEPDILDMLQDLWKVDKPNAAVLVLVVFNFSEASSQKEKQDNINQADLTEVWFDQNKMDHIQGTVIRAFDLADKYAGVGLARRIGMDSALDAFMKIDCDGWIINLDADCHVSNNYLLEHEKAWLEEKRGAICYFEHAMDQMGMVTYELYLRYYVQALKWAGFTYASHTIGSTFAVRASVYAEIGGMNRRKAGEDFYFIQKLLTDGAVKQMVHATVFPSDRISQRVPFGTGKAIENYHAFEEVYGFEIFSELKKVLFFLKALTKNDATQLESIIPIELQKYFTKEYINQLKEIAKNTSDQDSFGKRTQQWFNNFQAMKFIHRLRDSHGFKNQSLEIVCVELLNTLGIPSTNPDIQSLLIQYRKLDKQWENE